MPSYDWNRQRWTSSLQQYVQTQPGEYGDQWGTPDSRPELHVVLETWLLPFVGAGQTILEIGSGGGRWTQFLLHSKALHCVDINQVMLDYLAQRFNNPVQFHPYQTSGSDLPALTPGSVDFVFSFGTMVHIEPPDIGRYLDNLQPLLHSGSNVVLQYSDKTKPKAAKNIHFSNNNALRMENMLCQRGYQVVRHDTALLAHSNIVHARWVKEEPPAPLSLSTEAPVRLLAWPNYQDPKELFELFSTYGTALSSLPGFCLCLRYDPQHDTLSIDQIQQLVNEAYTLAKIEGDLDLLLIDNALTMAEWPSLGRSITASIALPSGAHGYRAAFSSALRVPRIRTSAELTQLLSDQS